MCQHPYALQSEAEVFGHKTKTQIRKVANATAVETLNGSNILLPTSPQRGCILLLFRTTTLNIAVHAG